MVDATGIEPVTPSMSTRCSPAELRVRLGSLSGSGRRGYNGGAAEVQALWSAIRLSGSRFIGKSRDQTEVLEPRFDSIATE